MYFNSTTLSKKVFILAGALLFSALGLKAQVPATCIPTYTSGCGVGDDIDDVTLVGISQTLSNMNTPCPTGGYIDYTTSTTLGVPDMLPTFTYNGTVTTNYSCCEYVTIWIDYDDNGTFAAGELVTTFGPISSSSPGSFSVTVPAGTAPGMKRMRVALTYGSLASGPCFSTTWGETHDYKVNILSPSPCTNPPAAGVATVTPGGVACPGANITLNLTGIVLGSGQTYEWFSSTDGINFTSLGAPALGPSRTTAPLVPTYYRCRVVCNGGAPVNSSTIFVDVAPGLSGAYTINSALPTANRNFNNFTDAAAALNCGIIAPVTIDVVPNSGPYNERFLLNNIGGSSPINTVTINGNGNTLQFNPTSNANQNIVVFNGTKYLTLDSLTIKTLNPSFGWGVTYTGGAKYDTLRNCHIDLSVVTTTLSTDACGIAVTNSLTSPTSTGYNGSNLYIANNLIDAGSPNAMGGAYYGVSLYGQGSTTYGFDSSYFINNEVRNYYYFGVYAAYGVGNTIKGNDVHKTNKTATTTTYGMYLLYQNEFDISDNRIHDFSPTLNTTNTHYGLYVYYPNFYGTRKAHSFITNNAVYNMGNLGGTFYGIYAYYGDSVTVAHNTVDVSLTTPTGTSTSYGLYVYNITNSYFVKNNNIHYSGGNLGTKYGIYCASNTMFNVNTALQNNNVFMNSSQTGAQHRIYYGTNYTNLAAFQAAFPTLETQGIEADPQYFNAAAGLYIPMNQDILMQGEDLTNFVPRDIVGNTRPSPPTPGAWDLAPQDYDNAGVVGLISPRDSFCGGNRNVVVTVENFGMNDIDTVTVNWSIDGAIRPPVRHTNRIFGTSSSTNNITNITLGQELFLFGRTYTLKAWTTMPNNRLDDYNVDDTLTIMITPTSGVLFDLGSDTTICDNNSILLTAGTPGSGFTYSWDNLANTHSRWVSQPGTYHVLKTQTNTGCAGVDTITITNKPAPQVNLGPDLAFCEGDSVMVDVGSANYAFNIVWSDNSSNDPTRYLKDDGIYVVKITAPNGCFEEDSIKVEYKDIPTVDGINTLLALDGSYNFNARNPRFVVDLIWDYGDGSPRDTGFQVSHRYATNGKYTVTVYMVGECGDINGLTSYSETVDIFDASTGVKDLAKGQLKLYPNPATNLVTIEAMKTRIQEVEIFNVIGQKVGYLNLESPSNKVYINTDHLNSGMYNLHIKTEQGVSIQKMEIVK